MSTQDDTLFKALTDALQMPAKDRAVSVLSAWREAEAEMVDASGELDASAEVVQVPSEADRLRLIDRLLDYVRKDDQPDEHQKAAIKRENGIDFPARDYAYVPDPQLPSSWKLRLTETPGKVTVAQLGRAAAALSAGGFRGQRVEIPPRALSAIKRRIRAEYRKLGVADSKIPASVREGGSFKAWKQADGQYRWMAVYSNCFRDDDYPPEIISKESHELYVDMVDAGLVDYPELWHYHVPGTAWGKADWVGFADGFALASGTVWPGHEKEADALAERDDIGVSHGMPLRYILRDPDDDSVIITHVTTEISPLPYDAAANKITGFFIKEHEDTTMALNQQKKQHLLSVGFTEADVMRLEAGLKEAADLATQAGIESKEATDEPTETEQAAPEANTPAVPADEPAQDETKNVTETTEAPVAETGSEEKAAVVDATFLTRDEARDAFLVLGNALGDMAKSVSELTASVNALKEQQAAADAKEKEGTPALSLADLIGQAVFSQKAAEVDGRSALAKSKPQQAVKQPTKITGIPLLDGFLNETVE